MALDPSIILGAQAPHFETPLESQAKSATLQKLIGEREAQQFTLQQAREARADDLAMREAFRAGGSESEILSRLRGVAPKAAMAYEKSMLEGQKTRAETGAKTSETQKREFDMKLAANNHIGAILLEVKKNPALYPAAKAMIAKDFGPQAVADAPEQYDAAYLDSKIAMSQTLKDRLEQQMKQQEFGIKQQEFGLKQANEPFIAGPGGPMSQPAVQAFQTGKARAGAPSVSVKTDVKTGESLAAQVGPMMKESTNEAEAAVKQVLAAQRIVRAVDSGKIITGPLANQRLVMARVGQALGVGGATEQEKIANTQQAIRSLAELTLQGRQQMRGQGAITVSEGELAQRAVSGDIDLSGPEIKALAQAAERAGRFLHGEHQRKLRVMQQNPDLQRVSPFYEGPAMPGELSPAPAPAPARTPRRGTPAASGVNPANLSDDELKRELGL